jgi:ATPase subunit of ABC transporter with duplicated ATPase domains
MIIVQDLVKSYGSRILFEKVSVQFSPNNHYGLTGPNGAGKSTFLKILQGDEESSGGIITVPRRVGILRQDQFKYDQVRIIDTVLMGNKFLWSAMEERDQLCEEENITDEMGMRLAELEMTIAEENGYVAENEAIKLLQGIGIPKDKHFNLMTSLPTDLKFRVLLAQALFGDPDALFLDEPTNYLDLESINWLENRLKQYNGTLIVISHDRHFLNSVCTHIADIDYDTVIIYPGNYDDMVLAKTSSRERIENENREKARKIEQLQDFVNKFGAGTRSTQAQSKKKEIERIGTTELKKSNIQRPYIKFDIKRPSGKEVLTIKEISKSYTQEDGSVVQAIKDFSTIIRRGEKVGIIGNNGLGKTTLLRILMGELVPDSGSVINGHEVTKGYFPQDYKQEIVAGLNAFEWLERFAKDENSEILRSYLGRMLFSGEEALKKTEKLSGGESARLIMARLMLEQNNLLILDEPTNHLDLEAVSALSEAIKGFTGTVIFVTHDRDLISNAASRIIAFRPNNIIDDYSGPYEEYLFSLKGKNPSNNSSGEDGKENKNNKNKGKNKKEASVYDNL